MPFVLEEGEVILLRDDKAKDAYSQDVALILTNKNVIKVPLYPRKGVSEEYYALSDFRESNGTPNICIGKGRGGKNRLELYFEQNQQYFTFRGIKEEKRWASAITKAYKNRMKEIAKSEYQPLNPKTLLAPVIDRIDAARGVLSQREQRISSVKCPFCGAINKGNKGEKIQCAFCESSYTVK